MRGLKHQKMIAQRQHDVASFTDAWIETEICFITYSRFLVASFTDAWIETRIYIRSKSKAFVASFTDAWIETNMAILELPPRPRSHLLQMRGLKRQKGNKRR